MLANNARSTGCPSTSATAGSAISWKPTSIGPCRANATGARRCRSGSASKTGKMEAVGSYDELLAKPGVPGTEVWEQAKAAKPGTARRPEGPQAVHRRGHLRFAVRRRRRAMQRVTEVIDCWYDCGAMPFAQWGYPHSQAASEFKRPVPGRLHQRGHRPNPRLVLQPAGDQHDVVRRRSEPGAGSSCEPRPIAGTGTIPTRIRSATASCWA